MNPKVDWFFEKEKRWHDEFGQLRAIALSCKLNEELKWGQACYTLEKGGTGKSKNSSNVVLIHGFKDYCAFLFFKGALMKDPQGILIQQTEKVQGARQIRFTSVHDITRQKKVLKEYIKQAIEIEKAGLKVEFKKTEDFEIPEEFQQVLDEDPKLRKAFYDLTPGRQRAYIFYFSSAKQSKTRLDRIQKFRGKILNGKGMDD